MADEKGVKVDVIAKAKAARAKVNETGKAWAAAVKREEAAFKALQASNDQHARIEHFKALEALADAHDESRAASDALVAADKEAAKAAN